MRGRILPRARAGPAVSSKRGWPQGTAYVATIVARTALRRLGTADDVARACLFLASNDAALLTGAAIPICGGLVG